jgi:signal peptidase I
LIAADAAAPTPSSNDAGGAWRSLLEIPMLLGLAVVIVVVTRWLLVQPFYIPSGSMLPQLQLQDKIVVSRMSYRLHPVRRGDIVVFVAPPQVRISQPDPNRSLVVRAGRYVGERLGLASNTDDFIKRVIGLPGDTVEGANNHVYVNGRLLLEPYLPPATVTTGFPPQKIPDGQLWVMGDNRTNSEDSRMFGPIRQDTVVGRAFLRVWPVPHIAFL